MAPKQNGSARSKLTEELDNLDLTWSAPDTPEHVADNAAGAGAEPVDVQEEGHAQHTFDEEAGTDEAVGSAITLREVGVSVSPGTEGGAPGGRFAPHSDFGSERGAGADRRADDDGKTFQGDRANVAQDEEDDGEEAFVYPGADTADDDTAAEAAADARPARSSGEAPQVGLGATSSAVRTAQIDAALASTLADVAATSAHPSEPASAPAPAPAPAPSAPIDHARLSHLCSTGPLSALQAFFASTAAEAGTSSFALANEANPASGYSPLHYAAREGKLEIAKWLVEECGALVEMEDREGEVSNAD